MTEALTLRALFDQRISGDDALLRLARLRFAQSGLAAETYADHTGRLDWILGFLPPDPRLPVVHLSRQVNLLTPHGQAVVEDFATRFTDRVWGLVVHDKNEMASRTDDLIAALGTLDSRLPGRPYVFLEYAAGHDPNWFIDVGERIRALERVSLCIDVGHVGIKQARESFRHTHPDVDLADLTPEDPRLPDLVGDVQAAVGTALPSVLHVIERLGPIGKPLHFHLHDGHPLIPGLSDHFSFLTQIPIPFVHDGRKSLPPMYGPSGLSDIIACAIKACIPDSLSTTLEIHQAEGRLPLGDAAGLFAHWRDKTNAERMNHWLAVLAQNAMLVTSSLRTATERAAGGATSSGTSPRR